MKISSSIKIYAILMLSFLVSACTSLGLGIANIPAKLSDDFYVTEISYGNLNDQKADLYIPQKNADYLRPVLIFFYGGSWDSGKKEQYAFFAKHYVEQGYIVVVPDYQKYPDVVFPTFVEDGALAVNWIKDHISKYGGNPEQIILLGHSAGAHIAALLATDQSYFTDHLDGYQSIIGLIGLSGPYAFEPEARKFKEIFGPPERYPLMRAPNFVDGSEPPIYLMHGKRDGTVAPENTKRFARALKDKNVPVQSTFYDGVGHMGMIATYIWYWRGEDQIIRDFDDALHALTQRKSNY